MITRIWHGRTSAEKADTYLEFLLSEGTREYRQTNGNLSSRVWKKLNADTCDFWTVSEWRDVDAIRDFAGSNYHQAKYYPFDESMLMEFEEHVDHYEDFDVSNAKVRNYINQLVQLYDGGNWVAESFTGKLRDLSEADAFRQPVAGVHSVAELVWHCIYWRRVTLHRLEGDKDQYRNATMEKYNFLPLEELRATGWEKIRQDLEDTQTKLIDLLTNKTDPFLNEEYQPGYSFDFLINGTIQHDYYHLGQIGLVIKIIAIS